MAPRLNRRWLGIAGVPAHDAPQAYVWEKRLHWVMLGFALLAVLSYYLLEVETDPVLRRVGRWTEISIFAAFSAELLWMLWVTRQKLRYLLGNWLDVLIVCAAFLSVAGYDAEWVAWGRFLRLAVVSMVLARAAAEIRTLFSPGGVPYVFGFAVLSMLAAGAGFYWLDPAIPSYADGLWLAFVTAATVGYGDVVPTTTAARVLAVVIVVIGVAFLSMVTASVAAFFIGEDEKLLRKEMHQDIRRLREDVAHMISEEERALTREVREDVRVLREEVRTLREELERERILQARGLDRGRDHTS
jgi:voltage-gated potassium channel